MCLYYNVLQNCRHWIAVTPTFTPASPSKDRRFPSGPITKPGSPFSPWTETTVSQQWWVVKLTVEHTDNKNITLMPKPAGPGSPLSPFGPTGPCRKKTLNILCFIKRTRGQRNCYLTAGKCCFKFFFVCLFFKGFSLKNGI